MDRPTKGSTNPNDRKPIADPGDNSVPDDAWTDALQPLQAMARKRELLEAAQAAGQDSVAPAYQTAPHQTAQHPAPPPPALEEALDALQALARRYNAAAYPPPAAGSEPADGHADFDDSSYEPPPADWEDPTPSVRMLRRKRPGWASLTLILASAAVLALLLVGALSLSRQLLFRGDGRAELPPAVGQDLVPAGPASATIVVRPTGAVDLPAIEKAMADCDDEAAKNPDALYFLIVPAISPTKDYQTWSPLSVGDIGTSVILLRSKDALDGLRNGSLVLFTGPYKFSIIDSNTDLTHAWPTVTGVTKFAKSDAAAISGFRVRFGFSDVVGDTPSNFRFPRDKGVCYWVSALLRT